MSATRTDGRAPRVGGPEPGEHTVAITGAGGPVGPALLARLSRAESVGAVRVLAPHPPGRLPRGAEFRRARTGDPATLARAVAGADAVVHMADAPLGLREGEDALFDANVRGALHVARAAAAAGARRFLLLSSALVYGMRADNPQPLAETAEIRASARHFYARQKAQAELLVSRALAGTGTELYVLRTCAVLGPHAAAGVLDGLPAGAPRRVASALRRLARTGLRPALPAPPVPLQFVHEEDVAQAIVLAVHGAGEPGVYNLAAEDVVGGHETLERLGVRHLPLPRVLVEAGLRAAVAASRPVPAAGWPEALTEPLLTDSTRARRGLGWEPHYSSRAALDATRQAIGW